MLHHKRSDDGEPEYGSTKPFFLIRTTFVKRTRSAVIEVEGPAFCQDCAVSPTLPTGIVHDPTDLALTAAHDRRHEAAQHVAVDPARLRPCGQELQPLLSPLAGHADLRRCANLPAASDLAGRQPQTINQIVCGLRFFYGVTFGEPETKAEISAGSPSRYPARRARPRRSRPLLDRRRQRQAQRGFRDGVRRRLARLGGTALNDRRYRQRADGDPCPAGQRQQGPLRHAVGATARHLAGLLGSERPQQWLFPGLDPNGR